MRFVWDDNKRRRNIALHTMDFGDAAQFEWKTAHIVVDQRQSYGELRLIATGKYKSRLTVLVFTERFGQIRIISWRRANKREIRSYENLYRS